MAFKILKISHLQVLLFKLKPFDKMTLKAVLKKVSIFLILFSSLSIQLVAQETNISTTNSKKKLDTLEINAEVNYLRHYLWRAIEFGSNDVSQPVLSATYHNFLLALSANLNYFPKNLPKELYKKQVVFDEQDVEIGYSNNYKKLDYAIKADAYFYFNQIGSPSTVEANISFEYPLCKNIVAFTENVFDVRAYAGSYYNNTGLQWEYEKDKNIFSIKANAGSGNAKFNEAYFGGQASGIFYWGTSAAIVHNFNKFYARLNAEYNLYTKDVVASTALSNTSNFAISFGKDFRLPLKK